MAESILVIGGQRSGKSRHAEGLVKASGKRLVYLATAAAGDEEMARRIAVHRARRGTEWQTVEEPLEIAGALRAEDGDAAVLIECLTLWLSNVLEAGHPVDIETGRLIDAVNQVRGLVVVVSNEVGSGIIPNNALARAYADALGTLNQRVAAAVNRVVLVAAGLPLTLKPQPGAVS